MLRTVFASKVLLIILGIAWCVAMIRGLDEDIATVRDPTNPESRYVVIGFWVVTAGIAFLLATSGVGVVREFLGVFSGW